ncbi:MAG: DUF362 domain-containing protein [Pseudomonadota bacterium]
MSAAASKSRVYFLPWEERDRLPDLLEQSGASSVIRAGDLAAIKMHFGEKNNNGYIRPELVRPIIGMIRRCKASPFLTDTNTIYRGSRSNAVDHLAVAAEHGFSQTRLQTPVIIADGLKGDDYEEVEIEGKHFKSVKIATAILKADAIVALSHFKGHLLAGFGGAIKNMGMGCGARIGKFEMHSGVAPEVALDLCTACGQCVAACGQDALSIVDGKVHLDVARCAGCGECVVVCDYRALNVVWQKETADVQERFAEYAAGGARGKRAFYLNFLNHITPNCDCMSSKEEPIAPDIGILASADPVAIDQASLTLVIERAGDVFAKAWPDIDCTVQLEHAERLGMGKREYKLVKI